MPSVKSLDPLATKHFQDAVLDAVWTSDDSITVCGHSRLELYNVPSAATEESAVERSPSLADVSMRDLALTHSYTTEKQWDKIRYDARHQVVAATSSTDDHMILLAQHGESWRELPGFPTPEANGKRTAAMAFEPLSDTSDQDTSAPRRLAVAHDAGDAYVYAMNRDSCELSVQLSMRPYEPALALAWSPKGSLLAVASDEAVKIWNLEANGTEPFVAWQAAPAQWYQGNDNNLPGDEEGQAEPSLSWDADGKRLVFAVGRKVCHISLP